MVESRIVILTTQLEPAGAQKASSTLSKLLHVNGINNRLVFLYKKIEFNYLKDYEIPHDFLLSSNRIGLFDIPLILFKLYRLKPELLIAFTHYSIFLSILLKLFRWDLKIVACHRNPFYSYPKLVKFFFLLFYNLVDVTTFVSEDTKTSFFPRKGLTIHNPIGFYPEVNNPIDFRLEDRFVLCVGRLSEQKNYVEFFNSLSNYDGSLRIKIVGSGPLESELRDSILKNNLDSKVDMLGNISHQEVISLMKKTECFIMTSIFEGTSNSLVEALYFAKRVAINNIPSLIETCTYSGVVSASVFSKDFNSWIELLRMIEDDSVIDKSEAIIQKFDNQVFVQKYISIINKLTKH